MRKICLLYFFISLSVNLFSQNKPSIHGYSAKNIDGYNLPFTQFYGKKIMLVNTASFCGFTSQFSQLEQLYQTYKQHNFIILGFPCNDFGAQEPFSDSVIKSFAKSNYGISFPLMSKVSIASGDTSKIYKWLQEGNLNGVDSKAVTWNFNKFLVNESGNWVAYHPGQVSPLDSSITKWIMSPSSLTNVGAENLNDSFSFIEMLSPNPTSSKIELAFKENITRPLNIHLYSIDGKMAKKFVNEYPSNTISCDISSVDEGIYFLVINDQKTQKNLKVIITR